MEQRLIKKKNIFLTKGNKLHLAEVCNDLAEYYMRIGNYELSKKEFINEAQIYGKLDKPILYARANRMIGEICTSLAEFDEALKYENIHLRIARDLKNEREEQRALASIGRTYLIKAGDDLDNIDSESLQLALKFFHESLSVCEKLKNVKFPELSDMKARLYLNIGIVNEHQGDFEKGEDFIKKSIDICKDAEIYDQLRLGYYTLGQLYSRVSKYSQAINSFKFALEVASRLTDKVIPLCTTYMAISDTLIKMKEFISAKQYLIKAYKLKTPNLTDHTTIEQNLRIVAAICQTEESLLLTSEKDYKKRKKLYERIGDGAVDLKAFQVAIDYYSLMLECALANGEKGKDLLPVYISLAQTYKDNRQYEEAYRYFHEDYKITKSNPEESYKTLLNIADVMELMNSPYEDVIEMYIRAREQSQSTFKKNAEGKVLSHFIQYLKKMGKPYEDYESQLSALGYESSDDEGNSEDDAETPDIGSNINIEDIIGDDCESDDDGLTREKRRRGRQLQITKNDLGETQLHLACKSGNIALVTNLIAQNHPINMRDYSGWLPIHEACNYGLVEIVGLLIDKGAFINDRGGPKCLGVTPLHDACANGHLEVIELLLNKGASPIAQTDQGHTPLDYLLTWRHENDLPAEQKNHYNILIERLTSVLKKAGKSVIGKLVQTDGGALYVESKGRNTYKQISEKSKGTPKKSPNISPQKSPIGSLRYSVDVGDNVNQSTSSRLKKYPSVEDNRSQKVNSLKRNLSATSTKSNNSVDTGNSACNEYKRVIDGLRNRVPELVPKKSKKFTSPFLADGDVDENNWLDDDLGNSTSKKRKRSSGLGNSPGVSYYSDNEQENAEPNINQNSDYESGDSMNSFSNNKRKSQASLLDSGFVRNRSESPLNIFNSTPVTLVDKITNKAHKRQQKLNSFVGNAQISEYNDLSTSQSSENSSQCTIRPSVRSVLPINVKIENKLWRIPVPAAEVNDLTIEWLANEAAKRYYKQEGISPTLQLLTKEGAFLVNEDPLSMVFISETQAEEIQSNIVSWNLPPIDERYVEACNLFKIDQCLALRKSLKDCQITLNLKLAEISLKEYQLTPLFRALNRQNNLQHLDLSDAKIKNEGISLLCSALSSLVQLRSLNLSGNRITEEGIKSMADCMDAEKILENLNDLNLSFNKFEGATLHYLAIILRKLKLRVLNLCGCNLPPHIFELDINCEITLNFGYLEHLDISYNDLNSNDIIKFISFLNFNIISILNVSLNNNVRESGITASIAQNMNHCDTSNLKKLNLTNTKSKDSEIWDLLRSLKPSSELDSLTLSFNSDLTAVSLRRLLQHRPTFPSLSLLGCKNILQYFDQFTLTSDPTDTLLHTNKVKSLIISTDYKQNHTDVEILVQIWNKEWGDKARVKRKLGKQIHFCVEE